MIHLQKARIAQDAFSISADFILEAGPICAVIGPSGAGKSTLLAGIAGFLPLSAGRLILDGEDCADTPPGQRPVSFVFQDSNLFPHLTAFENVALGIRPDLRLSQEDRTRVTDAFAAVGLDGFSDRKPGALSGGQQSRVALARVLLRRKPVLLLDEPFAALGPSLRKEMLDLVKELAAREALTVLMVTHDPSDAQRIADKLVFVADGIAEAPVPLADALERPSAALRDYLG